MAFWFRRKSSWSARYKVNMWQAVVRTSILYGALIVGLKQTGVRQLFRAMTVMQHMLLGDHSFQTHCSHSEFFRPSGHNPTSSADILHGIQLDGPREILNLVEQIHTASSTVDSPLKDRQPTAFSDLAFQTKRSFWERTTGE